ncbi:30S ribosome-binding factor RbfA [Sedimentibacter sp. zth1]|uniref:30S ribosome-binding factor RbfA n=1 Tax=Sedimentibacter sp. zth1 TaxID=2816908 RepID=UPI001A92F7EB|nr:30S ribosome-binding factor RbfA [Sedimentibacter sp. zth1]QSX06544.1 30S ribosome-binding factor RbfA [Sedimentibacter sp. zth1]
MSIKRNNRLMGEMKKIISEIIRRDVKDPRISEMLSITDLKITEDLKTAKVYVSIYGESEPTIDALNRAKGFIRRELSKKMKIRTVPELFFEKDYSIEKGIYMSNLIDKVINQEASSVDDSRED